MCLILQETCCLSLVLKSWRLDQETSQEKLFIKVGQIARHVIAHILLFEVITKFLLNLIDGS